MIRALVGSVLVLALAGPLVAQNCQTPNGANPGTCSINVASSLTIPTLLRVSIDDTTTSLTTPTEAIYNSGTVVSSGPVVTIKTNSPWTLLIRGAAATWTGIGAGARANKPVGDLGWNLTGVGAFTPMSTVNATVASGTRGAAHVQSLFYQVNWSWPLDTPGTYSLSVIFTVTSP